MEEEEKEEHETLSENPPCLNWTQIKDFIKLETIWNLRERDRILTRDIDAEFQKQYRQIHPADFA